MPKQKNNSVKLGRNKDWCEAYRVSKTAEKNKVKLHIGRIVKMEKMYEKAAVEEARASHLVVRDINGAKNGAIAIRMMSRMNHAKHCISQSKEILRRVCATLPVSPLTREAQKLY